MSKSKKISLIVISLSLVSLILSVTLFVKTTKQTYNRYRYQYLDLPKGFTITAHTGCMNTKDNSLESIETGVQYGAQIVEFDLNFNQNNEPILSHDASKGGEVTLDEALKKVSEYDNLKVNVDLKNCAALEKIKEGAEKNGVLDRIFFTGVNDDFLEYVRKSDLGIPYYLNVNVSSKKNTDREYLQSLVKKVKDSGAVGINFNKDNASFDLVEIFHENGLLVSIWTVNKDKDMQKILCFAPDNITTKQPKMLNEIITIRESELDILPRSLREASQSQQANSKQMKLESSNEFLQKSFEWAVDKTSQFVVTGTKNGEINKGDGNKWYGPDGAVIDQPTADWAKPKDYIPAFWAGYYDRTAYYARDFVHQATGSHLVGYDEEVYNMFKAFVSSASEKTGWFALWALNFDGSPYYMDTPNLNEYVREITAQFELVETAYKLYCRTGDDRYINDEVIFNFIEKTMSDFIDNLDGAVLTAKNGIPEGFGDIFKITATYNERGFHAAESGDSIAAMYQAILAYANILDLRGNSAEAKNQFKRAKDLKDYFNNEWSVIPNSDMYAYAIDDKGKKHYKWYKKSSAIYGGESLFFIPLKQLSYAGERNDKLLDYIHKKELDESTRADNIESLTYLPDVFFANKQSDRAWFWMKHIIAQIDLPHERESQGTNGDYPEISFTFVSQVIEGLMGISVNAADETINVFPNLPKEIEYIKLTNFKVGNRVVDIIIDKGNVTITDK